MKHPPSPLSKKEEKKAAKAKVLKEKAPKADKQPVEDATPAPGKTTKIDASLFLCLGLFNFFSTQLLIGFLAGQIELIQDMFLETNTMAALASILLTIVVIRPNFRNPTSRRYTFLIFLLYIIAVGFQIFTHQNYTPTNYFFTPAIVAMVSLLAAIILGFARIDKLHSSKTAVPKTKKPATKQSKANPPVSPKIQEKARKERSNRALKNPKQNPNPENNPIKDMLNLEKPQTAAKETDNLSVPQAPRETSKTAPQKINFAPKKKAIPIVEPRGEATDKLKELEAVENANDPLNQLKALTNPREEDLIPEATPKKWQKNQSQSASRAFSAPQSSKKPSEPDQAPTKVEDEDQLLDSLKLSLPKRNKKE